MDDLAWQMEQALPRLRRYARALVGDPTRADDIVQDCLERAWSRRHLFRPGSDLRAWLFTILHNVHANAARRYTTRPAHVPLTETTPAEPVRPRQADDLELGDLHEALGRLSEDQRQVLLLVGMEQLQYREVADVLGVPIGTVMSRLHRAREHLREELARESETPPRRPK
jgi:RNA polymerase sigma-70 factor (ECF subfamily)